MLSLSACKQVANGFTMGLFDYREYGAGAANTVTDKMPLSKGFQAGGDAMDLFRGAAPYYALFRRPPPCEVVQYLVERFDLNGRGRLLDVGCGTGQVFCRLAPCFEEVVGVDRDPEMVRLAKLAAGNLGLTKVQVVEGAAESISAELGKFRMVTFGASFHWMEQQTVACAMYEILEPNGAMVVLSPGGIHSGQTPWEEVIKDVLSEFLGMERRAGSGTYRAGKRHEEVLAETPFGVPAVKHLAISETWTLDEVVGYLYSTSYASRFVLGANAEAFEDAIRTRLSSLQPSGSFEKQVEYTVISALKASADLGVSCSPTGR
jgi:ubiquinone/menaquinone biosynthesis C-methylase UbiE